MQKICLMVATCVQRHGNDGSLWLYSQLESVEVVRSLCDCFLNLVGVDAISNGCGALPSRLSSHDTGDHGSPVICRCALISHRLVEKSVAAADNQTGNKDLAGLGAYLGDVAAVHNATLVQIWSENVDRLVRQLRLHIVQGLANRLCIR